MRESITNSGFGRPPAEGPVDLEPPLDISRDPRLRAVGWRDLVRVTPFEILLEPLRPAAWLGLSTGRCERALCNRARLIIRIFPHWPSAYPQWLSLRAGAVSACNGRHIMVHESGKCWGQCTPCSSITCDSTNSRSVKMTWKAGTQICRLGAPWYSARPSRFSCTSPHFVMAIGNCAQASRTHYIARTIVDPEI